jgi:hypothetical protein
MELTAITITILFFLALWCLVPIGVEYVENPEEARTDQCKIHWHRYWKWQWWPPRLKRIIHIWFCRKERCPKDGKPCQRPAGHP